MTGTVVPHQPVMTGEVLKGLRVRPDGAYVDCTIGDGGHALEILGAVNPTPRLLGIDLDGEAVTRAKRRLEEAGRRAIVVQDSYESLGRIARDTGFRQVDGVLFDLGVSTLQLESAKRGFSFLRDGRLDMRFDVRQELDAHALVNRGSESELAGIVREHGEEPAARRVARAIVRARPVETTEQLAGLVASAVGRPRGKTHPATRVFQALRIAVNQELGRLRAGLSEALDVMAPGGRLAVISYHSLEARIVKEFMRRESASCVCPPDAPACICDHAPTLMQVTRRVERPSSIETQANPRSRSALLRVAERI